MIGLQIQLRHKLYGISCVNTSFMRVAFSTLWGTVNDKLAVSELMALYRFTVIGLRWQAAPPKKIVEILQYSFMTCWSFLWWYVSATHNCSRPGSWQCGIMWVTDLRTSSHVTLLCDNSVYLIQQQLQHNLKHSEILFHPPSHTLGHTHSFVWGGEPYVRHLIANDRRWTAMPYVKGLCVRHVRNVDCVLTMCHWIHPCSPMWEKEMTDPQQCFRCIWLLNLLSYHRKHIWLDCRFNWDINCTA